MKRAFFVCLFLFLTITFLLSQSNPVPVIHQMINQSASVAPPISASQADPKAEARILDNYGKLPLSFEANHGQTDGRVKFLSRTSGYSLFLTGDEAVLALSGKKKGSPQGLKPAPLAAASGTLRLRSGQALEAVPFPKTVHGTSSDKNDAAADRMTGGVLRMKLRNANPAAKVTGEDELAGTSNYFIGNDPAKWRSNVPTYAKVKYEGIYSGIDLVYYGNQRQLEYDFIVAPGADPRRIAFDVRGAKRIRRDAQGDLVLKTTEGEIRWHKPVVYQEKNGTRQGIAARYAITAANRVGFEVAKYDASRPLYIDPLIYSTYLGGSGADEGRGIAVDSSGNAYITGWTDSRDFPTTPGAFQTTCCGAFVTKFSPTGSTLVYSTYFGYGSTSGIAVDSSGNAYVTGYTESTNFPVTPGAFQATCGGGEPYNNCMDAFVTKLDPSGSALVYSTYLGGSSWDSAYGIAVDSAGNAYVTGYTQSSNFPTVNPLQPTYGGGVYDAFVTKLNPSGSALVYSTYLGGSGKDLAWGIAVDSSGNAYVTGSTHSLNFPKTPGAFQTTCNGGTNCARYGDAFVTKMQMLAVTTTTLTPSPNPSSYGQAVTFTAAVNSSAGAPPDGETVTFKKGTTVLGTGSLSGGSASFTTSALPVGTTAIKAVYGGDSNFTGSTSKAVSQVVSKATTTTTLASSLNPSNVGQSVTFTASVTPQFSGTVTGPVTFYDGTTVLKTVSLSGGTAKYTTSTLTSGAHSIAATYNGNASFSGSSASLTQTVD